MADETSGAWGKATLVPNTDTLNTGGAARVTSVSCAPGATAGNCAAGGFYSVPGAAGTTLQQRAFVADETSGKGWGNALQVPNTSTLNTGGYARVNSVSCATAGNCAAGGYYTDSKGLWQAWVADETSGKGWANAQQLAGTRGNAMVNSVSCATAGNCTVGGYTNDPDGHQQAFVADETSTKAWAAQQVPGSAGLNTGGSAAVSSVSCASAGNCAAGGYYTVAGTGGSAGYRQAFVTDETSGKWGDAKAMPPPSS